MSLADIERSEKFQSLPLIEKRSFYRGYFGELAERFPDRLGVLDSVYKRTLTRLAVDETTKHLIETGEADSPQAARLLLAQDSKQERLQAYDPANEILKEAFPPTFSGTILAREDQPEGPRVEVSRIPHPTKDQSLIQFLDSAGKVRKEVRHEYEKGFNLDEFQRIIKDNAKEVGTMFSPLTAGATVVESLIRATPRLGYGLEETANELIAGFFPPAITEGRVTPRSYEEFLEEGSRYGVPGRGLRRAVARFNLPGSPRQDLLESIGETSLSRQLYRVLGEAPIQVGSYALLGPKGAALTNYSLIYESEFTQALNSGADKETARRSASMSAALQAPLEVIASAIEVKGVAALGGKILGKNTFVRMVENALASGISEAVTEGSQQVIANGVAQDYYDENRHLFEGFSESMVVGFLAGLIIGGSLSALQEEQDFEQILDRAMAAEEGEIPGETPAEKLGSLFTAVEPAVEEAAEAALEEQGVPRAEPLGPPIEELAPIEPTAPTEPTIEERLPEELFPEVTIEPAETEPLVSQPLEDAPIARDRSTFPEILASIEQPLLEEPVTATEAGPQVQIEEPGPRAAGEAVQTEETAQEPEAKEAVAPPAQEPAQEPTQESTQVQTQAEPARAQEQAQIPPQERQPSPAVSEQDLIFGRGGEPFPTEERARRIGSIANRGAPTEVVPVPGGFAAVRAQTSEETRALQDELDQRRDEAAEEITRLQEDERLTPAQEQDARALVQQAQTPAQVTQAQEAINAAQGTGLLPSDLQAAQGRRNLTDFLRQELGTVEGMSPEAIQAARVAPESRVPRTRGARAGQRLARFFNREVVFVENFPANGMVSPRDQRVIFLSSDATRPELVVVAHELIHQLASADPDLYARVLENLEADFDTYIRRVRPELKNESRAVLQEEFLGDFFAEKALQESFWTRLAERSPRVFNEFVTFVRNFIRSLRAEVLQGNIQVSDLMTDMRRVEDALVNALVEFRSRSVQQEILSERRVLFSPRDQIEHPALRDSLIELENARASQWNDNRKWSPSKLLDDYLPLFLQQAMDAAVRAYKAAAYAPRSVNSYLEDVHARIGIRQSVEADLLEFGEMQKQRHPDTIPHAYTLGLVSDAYDYLRHNFAVDLLRLRPANPLQHAVRNYLVLKFLGRKGVRYETAINTYFEFLVGLDLTEEGEAAVGAGHTELRDQVLPDIFNIQDNFTKNLIVYAEEVKDKQRREWFRQLNYRFQATVDTSVINMIIEQSPELLADLMNPVASQNEIEARVVSSDNPMDQSYFRALANGDTAAADDVISQRAVAAAYEPGWYHGSPTQEEISTFDRYRGGSLDQVLGMHVAKEKNVSARFVTQRFHDNPEPAETPLALALRGEFLKVPERTGVDATNIDIFVMDWILSNLPVEFQTFVWREAQNQEPALFTILRDSIEDYQPKSRSSITEWAEFIAEKHREHGSLYSIPMTPSPRLEQAKNRLLGIMADLTHFRSSHFGGNHDHIGLFFINDLIRKGYSGLEYQNTHSFEVQGNEDKTTRIVVNQGAVKRMETIVRSEGRIVAPSQRFNPDVPNIRFMDRATDPANPHFEDLAAAEAAFKAGTIPYRSYLRKAAELGLVKPMDRLPPIYPVPGVKEMLVAAGSDPELAERMPGAGDKVTVRTHRPVYEQLGDRFAELSNGGVTNVLKMRNVRFGFSPRSYTDGTSAVMEFSGDWVDESRSSITRQAQDTLASWVQIDANTERFTSFYDRMTGGPVASADEVIQVGGLLLAKGVQWANSPATDSLIENFSHTEKEKTLQVEGAPVANPLQGKQRRSQYFGERVGALQAYEQIKDVLQPVIRERYFDGGEPVTVERTQEAFRVFRDYTSGHLIPSLDLAGQVPTSTDSANQLLQGELFRYARQMLEQGDYSLYDTLRLTVDREITAAGRALNARGRYVTDFDEIHRISNVAKEEAIRQLVPGEIDGETFAELLKKLDEQFSSLDLDNLFSPQELLDLATQLTELGGVIRERGLPGATEGPEGTGLPGPGLAEGPGGQDFDIDYANARDAEARVLDRYSSFVRELMRRLWPRNPELQRQFQEGAQAFIDGDLSNADYTALLTRLGLSEDQRRLTRDGALDVRGAQEQVRRTRAQQQRRARRPASRDRADRLIQQIARRRADPPINRVRKINELQELYNDQTMAHGPPRSDGAFHAAAMALGATAEQADTLTRLAQQDRTDYQTDLLLRTGSRAVDRSIPAIIRELLKNPLLNLIGPTERLQLATRVFQQLGRFSEPTAREAAKIFDEQFVRQLQRARLALAERALEKRPVWANKLRKKVVPRTRLNLLEKIRRDIRTGAADPRLHISSAVAEANGWGGFTHEEVLQLHRIDKAIESAQTHTESIILRRKLIETLAEANLDVNTYRAETAMVLSNIFSSVKTFALQGSVLGNLSLNAFVRNPAAGILGDMLGSPDLSFGGWVFSMQQMARSLYGGIREMFFTFGHNINRVQSEEELEHAMDELQKAHVKFLRIWRNPDSSATDRTKAALKYGRLSLGRWPFRIIKSIDAGVQGAIRQMEANLIIATRAIRAGLTREQISDLLSETIELQHEFERDGMNKGLTGSTLRVYVSDRVTMAWYDALQGRGANIDGIDKQAFDEATIETGVHRIETGITGIGTGVRAFQERVVNRLGPIGRVLFAVVKTPYNVFHRSAYFSPWGIVRVLTTAYATSGDQTPAHNPLQIARRIQQGFQDFSRTPYERSLNSPRQAILRATEAAIGTGILTAVAALKVLNDRLDEEDKFFRINLRGPSFDRTVQRRAWEAAGNRPYTMQLRFGDKWFSMGFRRGGMEVLNAVFTLVGALSQAQENQTQDEPISTANYMASLVNEYLGESLFFLRSLTSRSPNTAYTEESVGNAIGFRAAAFIPFSSMLKLPSRFQDWQETEGTANAFLMQMPVAPFFYPDRPRLNGLGDPVSGESHQLFDTQQRLGVPLGFVFPSSQTKYYELFWLHKVFPGAPSRASMKELSLDQYREFIKLRGDLIKRRMDNQWKALQGMDRERFKSTMTRISRDSTIIAKARLRIP